MNLVSREHQERAENSLAKYKDRESHIARMLVVVMESLDSDNLNRARQAMAFLVRSDLKLACAESEKRTQALRIAVAEIRCQSREPARTLDIIKDLAPEAFEG